MYILRSFDFLAQTIQSVFWRIGFFFGFSLVSALSLGLVVAEEYHGRATRHDDRFCFVRHGKLHLGTEPVSVIGWTFLIAIILLINMI